MHDWNLMLTDAGGSGWGNLTEEQCIQTIALIADTHCVALTLRSLGTILVPMGQAALAFPTELPEATQVAVRSIGAAFLELGRADTPEIRTQTEYLLLAAEGNSDIGLNAARGLFAKFLLLVERSAADGAQLPFDKYIDFARIGLRNVELTFNDQLNDLRTISKMVASRSRDLLSLTKSAIKRLERLRDDWSFEYKAMISKLARIQDRAQRLKGSGRIQRAFDAYKKGFSEIFPYAKPVGVEVEFVDETPVYILKMKIANTLYKDVKRRIALEEKIDDIVAREDPDVIGLLAIEYEPFSSAP